VPQLQISLRRRISGLHKDFCSTFVAVTSIFGSSAKVPAGISMIDVVAIEKNSLLTYSFFFPFAFVFHFWLMKVVFFLKIFLNHKKNLSL